LIYNLVLGLDLGFGLVNYGLGLDTYGLGLGLGLVGCGLDSITGNSTEYSYLLVYNNFMMIRRLGYPNPALLN